ncbi:MAG: NADH:ubiquinone oxidoreductase [Alectoria fallacina]|uniref:NADH:ubiquinone oxidoreductase n=1 Tax=Alectoria fallacina TaxID=1903189 RepID=A0A8H3FW30_9LECA|nr:MAG: NADH:ubiquinone oxidoreductase [Alectoria fallacina]
MPSFQNSVSTSPSPIADSEDSLAYYKSQYEQLEAELADFQASSKELEVELEKDVEAAERRERQLQGKVEGLGFEVEEWKAKYKQSKAEANTAQHALQKEITTLRDTNRTLQLRLRDIEVSNDDFERQARNTTSSLEDLESKYNVSIERGVMAEEEIKVGEQEREALRIETQRLRDELSDLKIEAEIRQDKLRRAEGAAEMQRRRQPPPIVSDLVRPQSALSETSPTTSTSSPTIATPPTKSASSEVSETLTPPSPPASENSVTTTITTPALPVAKSRLSMADFNTTPRPAYQKTSLRQPRHSRGPSISLTNDRTSSFARRTTLNRPELEQKGLGLPQSGSLHQIRGLRTKMTNLEERLKSARSKLPAPTSTPPRASPRSDPVVGQSFIPATVTVRSNKKRIGGSNASSVHTPTIERPASRLSSAYTPIVDRPSSRLSFGIPQLSPTRDMHSSRPPSRDPHDSRPSSRASLSSRRSISHLPGANSSSLSRPSSRQSNTGNQTPLGHYAKSTAQSESRRPRSSIGGSYASTHGHGHSASVSRLSNYSSSFQHQEEEESGEVLTPTPSRRTTIDKGENGSSIPGIAPASAKKRFSGFGSGGRVSLGLSGGGEMGPPERRGARKLSGVGETF